MVWPSVLKAAASIPWGKVVKVVANRDAVNIVANLDKIAMTVVKWHDKVRPRNQQDRQERQTKAKDSIGDLRTSMASLNVRAFRAEIAKLQQRLDTVEEDATSQADSIVQIARRADTLLEGIQSMLSRVIVLSWALTATAAVAISALVVALLR